MSTFRKIASLDAHLDAETIGLQLHDPLTVWYAMAREEGWRFVVEDLRVGLFSLFVTVGLSGGSWAIFCQVQPS